MKWAAVPEPDAEGHLAVEDSCAGWYADPGPGSDRHNSPALNQNHAVSDRMLGSVGTAPQESEPEWIRRWLAGDGCCRHDEDVPPSPILRAGREIRHQADLCPFSTQPTVCPHSLLSPQSVRFPPHCQSPPRVRQRDSRGRVRVELTSAPGSAELLTERFRPGWFGDAMGTADGEIRCDILHKQAADCMSIGQITSSVWPPSAISTSAPASAYVLCSPTY
jgi:hypothetical protein